MPSDSSPPFPIGARIAGIIWIVVGTLGLFGVVYSLVTGTMAQQPQPNINAQQQQAAQAGQICGLIIAVLFYAIFLFVGIQTVRGRARGLKGNSIGSIVFSVLVGGFGALAMIGGIALMNGAAPKPANMGNVDPIMIILSAAFILLIGLGLLVAGILGLFSNSAYLDWRDEVYPERKRRRRTRDEEDDWDDDDRRGRSSRDDDDRDDRDDREPRRRDRD
jgi:hypothetical protein